MKVQVVARFKNWHFIQARERAGFPTQAAMARVTGIASTTISTYECFRSYPRTEFTRKRIELALGCLFEDMFPPLYREAVDRELGRPVQQVLTLMELPEWTRPQMIEQNPESIYDLKELKEEIMKSLTTLKPREGRVLQMRFGLGDERELSLEEIARKEDVTRERIRQIEAKAIRKLKHPGRSRPLKPFADIERHQGYKIKCPVCGTLPSYASSEFYFCDNYNCSRERWMTAEGKERRRGRRLTWKKREREVKVAFNARMGKFMGKPSLTETEKIERAQALMKDFLNKP